MGLQHYKEMRDSMTFDKKKKSWDEEEEVIKEKSFVEELLESDEEE
jgi:hypothetical protein